MKDNNYLFEVTKPYHHIMSAYMIDVGLRDIETSEAKPFMDNDFRVMAFEPNPQQIKVIHHEYLLLPDPKPHFWLIPVALGKENKNVEFICSPNIGHSRIENDNFKRNKWKTRGEKKVKVEQYHIDTILQNYRGFYDADVIKIDTEGNDTIILETIFEADLRPMFIQIEDWNDRHIMEKQRKLFDENGYSLYDNSQNQNKIYKKIN